MKRLKMRPAGVWAAIALVAVGFTLISWDFRPASYYEQIENTNDTIPTNKKRDSKARNLDEAIAELDALDLDREVEQALAEAGKAMKEIDLVKLKREMEEGLKGLDLDKLKKEIETGLAAVDFNEIEKEVAEAMKEAKADMKKAEVEMEEAFRAVDMEKIKAQVKTSIDAIDWEKIRADVEKAQKIDLSEAEKEIRKAQVEFERLGPEIRKNLEDAKADIEKAKVELALYKELVDGLHKDGLLDKEGEYNVVHEDGKLKVNGKMVSDVVYNKYKKILDQKKQFHLKKTEDGINIDRDEN